MADAAHDGPCMSHDIPRWAMQSTGFLGAKIYLGLGFWSSRASVLSKIRRAAP